ncbi:MAG: AAA family ATPase [Spirochaetia bacterium]
MAKNPHKSLHHLMHALVDELERVISDKRQVLELLVLSLVNNGHVLIEDLPGVGKTTAVKALAKLIGGTSHSRIQCTPDLLPYDITGVEIFDNNLSKFQFTKGPIFHNIVLVDEINRATPKTQSALLEAMAENQVTVGGHTHSLPDLFWVAGTQNPLELGSTYPLPVAELDRFLLKLTPGYPSFESECRISMQDPSHHVLPTLEAIVDLENLLSLLPEIEQIHCDIRHSQFAVRIATLTREHHGVAMGVSPRGPIGLIKLAKTHALFYGREFVSDEDMLALVHPVYQHRIITRESQTNIALILDEAIQVAKEEFYR